jgi:hypothetical protein
MVHVYYHIYAIDGVESIINEQLNLVKKHFDFPYILNVGISIADENKSISNILDILDKSKIRDVRAKGHEFVTLDLIQKDREKFGDLDYILYIHTKGASKQLDKQYDNIISWRHLMNYFNIEQCKKVFNIFEKTEYNTYGVLYSVLGKNKLYSGNFWWSTAKYIKTINIDAVKKNRFNAEINYIQNGIDWKPYSLYNREGENHYSINFKREEYAK